MSNDELSADLQERLDKVIELLDTLTIDAAIVVASVKSPSGQTLTAMRQTGNTWAVRGMTAHAHHRFQEDARIEERKYQNDED